MATNAAVNAPIFLPQGQNKENNLKKENEELKKENAALKKENCDLKRELSDLRKRKVAPTAAAQGPVTKKIKTPAPRRKSATITVATITMSMSSSSISLPRRRVATGKPAFDQRSPDGCHHVMTVIIR